MQELKITDALAPCLVVVNDWLQIEKGEKVLLIADTTSDFQAVSLMSAAVRAVGADPVVAVMSPRERRGAAPPEPIQHAASGSDVVINLAGSTSISYTRDRWTGRDPSIGQPFRSLTMPHLDIEMLTCGLVSHNYEEIISISDRLSTAMLGDRVRVTTAYGTDISADVAEIRPKRSGRIPIKKPGGSLVFPFGEVRYSPPRDVEGTLVIDTSIHMVGLIREPIRCAVRKSKIEEIRGGAEAEKLREILNTSPTYNNVVEIAIGANSKCRVTGNAQEDKKGLGRVHIGIGTKRSEGSIDDVLHIDGVLLKPTVEVDGRAIVKEGKILV